MHRACQAARFEGNGTLAILRPAEKAFPVENLSGDQIIDDN
jgi:hypothetical protein